MEFFSIKLSCFGVEAVCVYKCNSCNYNGITFYQILQNNSKLHGQESDKVQVKEYRHLHIS